MTTKTIFLFIIIGLTNSSCGILGVYSDNANRDPDHQAKLYADINNSPIAKQMDSLIRQIDSAESSIPSNLNECVLVVETFDNYSDFLNRWKHKFRTPQDTKAEKREFKKYQKKKTSLLKDPKFETVYLDKKDYQTKDIEKYRYILKTTVRLNYDPKSITIDNNGFVYPYVGTLIYYIHDRKTDRVFKEIDDIKVLTKQK
ncbi:MAG: hypothetical protein QY309_13200 [Cyclobacteriaceae bacterium]|nr:MAG: hypothetical protein QY309_13200 [Cyclobacteriaceae bacterium]